MANWVSNWIQRRKDANMQRALNVIGHDFSTQPGDENYISQNDIDWTQRYVQRHKKDFEALRQQQHANNLTSDLNTNLTSDLNQKVRDFYGTNLDNVVTPINEKNFSGSLDFKGTDFQMGTEVPVDETEEVASPEYKYLGYQGSGEGIWNSRAIEFAKALMSTEKGQELYRTYAREDGILDDEELKALQQNGLKTTGDGKVGINTLNAAKDYLNDSDYNTMSTAYNQAVEAARQRRAAQASSEERHSERPQNYEHNPYSNPESYDQSSSYTGVNNFDPTAFKYSVEGNWWEPSRDTSRDSNSYWDVTGKGFDLNEDGSRNYVGTRSWFGLGGTNHLENSRKEFDKWYNKQHNYSQSAVTQGNQGWTDWQRQVNKERDEAYEAWLKHVTGKNSWEQFKQGGVLRRIKLH